MSAAAAGKKRRAPTRPTPPADASRGGSTRWTRWIAYALIVLFGAYWAVTAFTRHTIGDYGVETDFYWKYGPGARDLLRGIVTIEHFDSKGFGYPVVLALVSLLGFDLFRAGQVVALLSAVGAAWILYRLHRSLFGPVHALVGLCFLLGNLLFLQNTYEVGTDMFFLTITLASVALLLRSKAPGWRAIVGSGLLGGWAFATRYNALFLLPGALLLFLVFRVPDGPWRDRWRRAGAWTAGFLVGALPWLIVNAIHTGNPLTNSNYVNVGYVVYGQQNWEQFFYGERQIHSLADVVLLDPGKFFGAMVGSFFEHVKGDLTVLLPWVLGLLAAAGAVLLAFDRPGRRVAAYFAFGALCFGTLVPVFYGARFSLPVLPYYLALAAWPVVSGVLGRPLARIERLFPLRSFAALLIVIPVAVAAYGRTDDPTWNESIAAGPTELLPAAEFLRTAPREEGEGLIARKPHAAFLGEIRFVPMPAVDSLDSLRAVAARERARYLLLSGAEMAYRPAVRPLAEPGFQAPGFRLAHESYGALVFEIVAAP